MNGTRAARVRVAWALIPLLVVLGLGCIFNQDGVFFNWGTHRALLREISVLGILACGMTLVILSGGIDLAVGSVLALCAVTFARLTLHVGWSGVAALGLVMVLGGVAGALSGLLVAQFRIQAFIASLAMMVFARGLAKLLAEGKKVTTYVVHADGSSGALDMPAAFELLDRRIFAGEISVVTLVFLTCALASWLLLERLSVGRYIYAVGGNLEAARLAGVPVRSTLLVVYVCSGMFSAIAGICQAAQETHGDPETGLGYELDAIAMVVLGGTSLLGGRGGIGLTLLGVLTLGYLQKILSLNAFSSETRLMLTGAILIGAVLLQRRLK